MKRLDLYSDYESNYLSLSYLLKVSDRKSQIQASRASCRTI